jgi:NAD(P)-dependent dehydrogenase (short-subunit alcohol dehydrogenase family)
MISLDGKAIVVTGAGRGLGRAYAEAIAHRGGAVVVNDVDGGEAEAVVRGIVDAGGRAVASPASVIKPDETEQMVELCVREFGAIDGLVNNAGIYPHDFKEWEDRPEKIRAIVEVNVLGVIFSTNAAVRLMKRSGSGTVLNVSSGAHLGLAGNAIYGGTKGAVTSLTYTWALDLMSANIRVNAVSPIAVTRMKRSPTSEHVDPSRIAPLVVYLLSDEAGGMIGQVVRLTGKDLSIQQHPRVGRAIHRDKWSAEDIAEAFRATLGNHLERIGRERVPSPPIAAAPVPAGAPDVHLSVKDSNR